LATDPAAVEVGADVGYDLGDRTLRAPGLSVGNVPNRPGWAKGAPALALEHADAGQGEEDLQDKIAQLSQAGTRYVWVVRLVGPQRVEVYERGTLVRVAVASDVLEAPGVLQNPVPVRALFDRDAALEVSLRNLLSRKGYNSLDEVRSEGAREGLVQGREEGREEGTEAGRAEVLRSTIADLCEAYGIEFGAEREATLRSKNSDELDAIRMAIKTHRRWPTS
jgi:hypothetical protein